MTFWKTIFNRTNPMAPCYGTSKEDPILCGGGPQGERDYLERTRCPCGTNVRYQRLESVSTTEIAFLQKPGISVALGPGMSKRRAATYVEPEEVVLDAYVLACESGRHELTAFLDMYHRGPERPIGEEGWSLAPSADSTTKTD